MTVTTETIVITPHDLPLCCHGAQTRLWDGHPKVFLPIESYSTIECPYCGTQYYLDGENTEHH